MKGNKHTHIAVSIVMNGELANETVIYDTEIKSYKFTPEVEVIKKGSPIERASLTHAFKGGVRNKNRCDCQWYIANSTEKKYFLPRETT